MHSFCFVLVTFACLLSFGICNLQIWKHYVHENLALLRKYNREFLNITQNVTTDPVQEGAQYSRTSPIRVQDVGPTSEIDMDSSISMAKSVLQFALNLSQKINSVYHKTLIFSPLSIMCDLALLALGAKGSSYAELVPLFGEYDMVKMHQQMGLLLRDVQQPTRNTISPLRQLDSWQSDSLEKSLRRYPTNPDATQLVNVANGVFVEQEFGINPDYNRAVSEVYKAEVRPLDFYNNPSEARKIIDAWVKEQTMGKIPQILKGNISNNVRLVLVNTLYFKALWEIDFVHGQTKVQYFYPNGEGHAVVPVEFMTGVGAYPYYDNAELDCHIIGIPYQGNLSTMYIIQPMKSSVQQLRSLQERLNANAIEEMIGKMRRRSIMMTFPKMHITESLALRDYLWAMGIQGIFYPAQYDLSLIVTDTRQAPPTSGLESLQRLAAQRDIAEASTEPPRRAEIIVSEILHKVDFNIDEQGTEAAAASAAIIDKAGPELKFHIDSPFILLVRHDLTKLPLFYGIINEPPRGA